MRLYVSSARRWREGSYTVQFMMKYKAWFEATWYLFRFVIRRLDLKELTE